MQKNLSLLMMMFIILVILGCDGSDNSSYKDCVNCSKLTQEVVECNKNLDKAIREKQAAIQEKQAAIQARDVAIREKQAAIQARDVAIREKQAAIQARDAAIREKQAAIQAKDVAIQAKDAAIRARDDAEAKVGVHYMSIGVYVVLGIVVFLIGSFILITTRSKKNILNFGVDNLHCPRCGWEHGLGETICKNCKTHF